MSTKGVADVVFCLDASASMQPCVEAVKQHIADFIAGLTANGQQTWDLRLDFIAHQAGSGDNGTLFKHSSVFLNDSHEGLYGSSQQSGRFFTANPAEFQTALGKITCKGDEAMLVAYDFCLDFPWRPARDCHRVIIMLTDEPCETGAIVQEQKSKVMELIRKTQDLRVMLFLVAPDSPIYQELAQADKSEYEVIDGAQQNGGLTGVDFCKVMAYIGKSVSVSVNQTGSVAEVPRGLFGQKDWGTGSGSFTGV